MPEDLQHLGVEAFAMILQRHVIDRTGIQRLDDGLLSAVAEQRDLGALASGSAGRRGTAARRAGCQ
jgi:hypothetical protein